VLRRDWSEANRTCEVKENSYLFNACIALGHAALEVPGIVHDTARKWEIGKSDSEAVLMVKWFHCVLQYLDSQYQYWVSHLIQYGFSTFLRSVHIWAKGKSGPSGPCCSNQSTIPQCCMFWEVLRLLKIRAVPFKGLKVLKTFITSVMNQVHYCRIITSRAWIKQSCFSSFFTTLQSVTLGHQALYSLDDNWKSENEKLPTFQETWDCFWH
jgi:hypothetical protein